MATSTQTDSPDLGLLLAQASHGLGMQMAAGLAELGISPRAHCVLSKAMSADLTQGQIAELSNLDKTTMVATIDQLEAAGLAERRPSSTDRRARIIAVTPAGRQMIARSQKIVDRIRDEVLAELPARERDALVAALERLVGGRLSDPCRCDQMPRRPGTRSAEVF